MVKPEPEAASLTFLRSKRPVAVYQRSGSRAFSWLVASGAAAWVVGISPRRILSTTRASRARSLAGVTSGTGTARSPENLAVTSSTPGLDWSNSRLGASGSGPSSAASAGNAPPTTTASRISRSGTVGGRRLVVGGRGLGASRKFAPYHLGRERGPGLTHIGYSAVTKPGSRIGGRANDARQTGSVRLTVVSARSGSPPGPLQVDAPHHVLDRRLLQQHALRVVQQLKATGVREIGASRHAGSGRRRSLP